MQSLRSCWDPINTYTTPICNFAYLSIIKLYLVEKEKPKMHDS